MTLEISPYHLQQISHQATIAYPQECCGLIVGKVNDFIKQTVTIHPMQNTWSEDVLSESVLSEDSSSHSKHDRYAIDPSAMLQVIKQSREQGLEIIGIYHSHPDHPAIPSECDRTLAWPQYSYIIVSVYQGQAIDTFCWCLDPQGNFQPEEMHILTA